MADLLVFPESGAGKTHTIADKPDYLIGVVLEMVAEKADRISFFDHIIGAEPRTNHK